MALFKIFKGNSANLETNRPQRQEGFIYLTEDDMKFYVDLANSTHTTAATLTQTEKNYRRPINASKTDVLQAWHTDPKDQPGKWTVQIPGITAESLVDGLTIRIRLSTSYATNGQGYNTLNVNGLGAKLVYYRYNDFLVNHVPQWAEIILTYHKAHTMVSAVDGTTNSISGCRPSDYTPSSGFYNGQNLGSDGWILDTSYSDGNNYERLWNAYEQRYAGAAVHPETLCMIDGNGKIHSIVTTASAGNNKVADTTPFYPYRVLYYAGQSAVASGAAVKDLYEDVPIASMANSLNTQMSAYSDLYLCGQLNDQGMFVLDSANYYVIVPNSIAIPANTFTQGKYYLHVGASDGTAGHMQLLPLHHFFYCADSSGKVLRPSSPAQDDIIVDRIVGTLPITKGGTGLTASPSMLIALNSNNPADIFTASPSPGVTGILGTGNGGTGNNSYTASRLLYTNTATKFATGSIVTNGSYLSNIDYLDINNDHQTTYRLYVNGISYFKDKIYNPDGVLSFVQNSKIINNTTDWNTLTTPGCYKVQMSSWGNAETYHSPNAAQSNLYSYGLLFVFCGQAGEGEKRIEQIYFPHQQNAANPIYCRMHNSSSLEVGWHSWHRLTKGSPTNSGEGATGTWGIDIAGNAATATNADKLDGYHFNDIFSYLRVIGSTTQDAYNFDTFNLGITRVVYGGYIANRPSDWNAGSNHYGTLITVGSNDPAVHGNYYFKLLADNNTKNLYYQVRNETTVSDWLTILSDKNYTTYTVKKDGTGATGTWGINISGNAETANWADKAANANITTTTNAVAYYTNNSGKFGSKASANGVLYATSANGALQWGILPIAQGGTGQVTREDARLKGFALSQYTSHGDMFDYNYNSQLQWTDIGDIKYAKCRVKRTWVSMITPFRIDANYDNIAGIVYLDMWSHAGQKQYSIRRSNYGGCNVTAFKFEMDTQANGYYTILKLKLRAYQKSPYDAPAKVSVQSPYEFADELEFYDGSGETGWVENNITGYNTNLNIKAQAFLGNASSATELQGTPGTTNVFLRGDNTWSNTLVGPLYINDSTDVAGAGNAGALVIGNKSGINLGIDDNEIMVRNNGTPATLYLQIDGGTIQSGANFQPQVTNTIDLGTSSAYWNHSYITNVHASSIFATYLTLHRIAARHLDAGLAESWNDSRLYIGYGSAAPTKSIGFYYSPDTSNRTQYAEINSNGLYANTRFGVNGQNTNYNFYVNGTSYFSDLIKNSNGVLSFVQNSTQVTKTTDFNTLETPGCYKVQVGTWGDAATYHSPNEAQTDIYAYGLLFVIRGFQGDTEGRVFQIYFPHHTNNYHPVYCRMRNSNTWQTWHRLTKGYYSTDQLNSGTLPIGRGGTGVSTHTQNRLVWSNTATSIQAGYHYASTTKVGINLAEEPSTNFYVNGTTYLKGQVTAEGTILPATNLGHNLGSKTQSWGRAFIRTLDTRHIDATEEISADHYLYIGYGPNGSPTTKTLFYYSNLDSNNNITRTQYAEINSNGLYALTRFGVNGQTTDHTFYVNGHSWFSGRVNDLWLKYKLIENQDTYVTNGVTTIFGNTTSDCGRITVIRMQSNAPVEVCAPHGSGIAWKGGDTYGILSVAYNTPTIKIAGGNGVNPVWYLRFIGTSTTSYNLDNMPLAAKAAQLVTGHTFTVKDNDNTNAGPASSAFNGTQDIVINLPATIKASLTGNATSASKWQTARSLTLSGVVNGIVSMDGSENVVLSTTFYWPEYTTHAGNSPRTFYWYKIDRPSSADGNSAWRSYEIELVSDWNYPSFAYYRLYVSNYSTAANVCVYLQNLGRGISANYDSAQDLLHLYICCDALGNVYVQGVGVYSSCMRIRSQRGPLTVTRIGGAEPGVVHTDITPNTPIYCDSALFRASNLNYYNTSYPSIKTNIDGNATSATKILSTPNNTTTFLRGDNTWSNALTGDLSISGNIACGSESGHSVATRHVDAGLSGSWSDSRLYIGYGPSTTRITKSIGFYYSALDSNNNITRTEYAELNSNGLYAKTRFGVGTQSTSYNFYVQGTSYFSSTVTMNGHLLPNTNIGSNIGSTTVLWNDAHIRAIATRHIDAASTNYASDSNLYIGYGSIAPTKVTRFYYSADTSSRTQFLEINSSGAYALTRFGVNGQNTSYNFYVNGSSYFNGTLNNQDGRLSFVQNNTTISNTTDWDTLLTPGCYKVQMSSWGDATTCHSPNEAQAGLYSYGLLFVFRGASGDGEHRVEQIYFPHNATKSHPIYCRMRNGADTSNHASWHTWHRLTRGSPTNEGVDATGTWAISITGNAATATNADKLDGYHENSFLRYRGSTSTNQEATLWNQIGTKQYNGALPDGLSSSIYNWGQAIAFATPDARLDIYAAHTASSGTGLWFRSGWSNDTSQGWARILDSKNYTDYAPTKTGSGASGTWSINVSGSAASLTTSRSLWGNSFNGTADITNGIINFSGAVQMLRWGGATDTNSTGRCWYGIGTYTASDNYQWLNISCYWGVNITTRGAGYLQHNGAQIWCKGQSITSAVWNDYAEYRNSYCTEPGRVVMEKGDDSLIVTQERMSHFAGVISDTWGFAQGETEQAKSPIAVAGRVLAYPFRNRNDYKPGDCVCAAPNGTVDIMTREEIVAYPDRIVGTVSCVPDYYEWGGGEGADRDPVQVNGRIWIKVK